MPSPGHDFDLFVAAELPRLLALARALSGNEHDAWDLAQESLVRVGVRWSRLEAGGNIGAYARTTVVRLNIDRLRRLRRELPTSVDIERGLDDVPAVSLDPWLQEALRRLSPRQRTAIVLRYGLDLEMTEIAELMKCSLGTCRSHLSRGLERLRQHSPGQQTRPHISRGRS